MSISRWRDPRYDYDAQERARRRQADGDEARRLVRLIRGDGAARDALLAALAPGIVAIVRAVLREVRS